MKDRLLGMSLSYHKLGPTLIDPLVREEVYFQGDASFGSYGNQENSPFQITSTSGFEVTRSVTENASPSRVQNRELTVYLRARDPQTNVNDVLGKFLTAVDTTAYSLNAPDGPFYVPTTVGTEGIVTLTLLMGDGTPHNTKRFECRVSIKSLTGDLFAPTNDIYVLVLAMHDEAFIRYDAPYTLEWDLPFNPVFTDDGVTPKVSSISITRLEDGITRNRLTRPRITIEATKVETTAKLRQAVIISGYYRNPSETNTYDAAYHNRLEQSMNLRGVVAPTDQYLNPGEKASITINDPLHPGDIFSTPRRPFGSHRGFYFNDGVYSMTNTLRGFDWMNFPVADGATVKIDTRSSTGTETAGADIKIKMDFFDILTGVVL